MLDGFSFNQAEYFLNNGLGWGCALFIPKRGVMSGKPKRRLLGE